MPALAELSLEDQGFSMSCIQKSLEEIEESEILGYVVAEHERDLEQGVLEARLCLRSVRRIGLTTMSSIS